MEATASLKFAKISVRKARIILDMVRGENVAEAIDKLTGTVARVPAREVVRPPSENIGILGHRSLESKNPHDQY